MEKNSGNRTVALLNQLRSGQDVKKCLESILSSMNTSEVRISLLQCNLLGVLNYQKISKQIDENSMLVFSIKLLLCRDPALVETLAFEKELIREAMDYIFIKIQSSPSEHGVYTALSSISSEFAIYSGDVYERLVFYFLVLYELGSKSDLVVKEINKYNLIPKLLFAIEKGPGSVRLGEISFKKSAQKLLNLILTYVEVASTVCSRLDLFKWVLRIAKQDLYKANTLEMMETLTLLSYSSEFLPKSDEELIVGEWVFGNLSMILLPEIRTPAFLEVNQGISDAGYYKLVSYLSQILGNVSKSQGGMEEIISAMEAYGADVVWRIHYYLLKSGIADFSVWYTVLYLTNNMLRYPYYNPPLYASQYFLNRIAVLTYGVIANISSVLVTIACRAFRHLEFTKEHKASLCEITIARYALHRISAAKHNCKLPPMPAYNSLSDSTSIMRNVPRITKEWNTYFEERKRPWETIYSPLATPEEVRTPQDRVIYRFMQQFRQLKLFFKKLPNPCEFCQDFQGPPFLPEDKFWKWYNPTNPQGPEDVDFHTPIVLLQFLSDITDVEDNGFLLASVIGGLNAVLMIGEGRVEERVKCGIITLYVTWTELRPGFISLYLNSGMLFYHQYYLNLTLQGVSKSPPPQISCIWNVQEKYFQLQSGKPTPVTPEVNEWRVHMVFHLLELLRTALRIAPESANQLLKKQCLGMVKAGYSLVLELYAFIDNDIRTKSLVTTVISNTEEVTYALIRRLPGLFFVIADTIEADYGLLKIFIDMTGIIPSLLCTYAHISTLYLFVSKDRTNKLAEKILKESLENFLFTIIRVLGNFCMIIDHIESSLKPKNLEIDKTVTDYLEKIILIKCVNYLLLSLLHCFDCDQYAVSKIPYITYTKIYDLLYKIVKFAKSTFMNKSIYDHSYNFPEGFRNSDIKRIPGSKNYIVVDFEEENEDDLFRDCITTVMSWIWFLSLTDSLGLEIINHPPTEEILKICYVYEQWTIQSYMAICGVLFNFSIMNTSSVINRLPMTIDMFVKYISELRIPIEGYLLLFQVIREIFPKLIDPSKIQRIQQVIAPLRSILSSDLPMLKYFNYPLLKEITPSNKKQVAIDQVRQTKVLEDERSTKVYFPRQLLKVLPIQTATKMEAYPGQSILQNEARSIMKMITPITSDGVLKTRQKINMHFKAGEGDLLVYKNNNNSSREERMSLLFSGVGSQIISHHYSINEGDAVKNKRSIAKLEQGFDKLIMEQFDREHRGK